MSGDIELNARVMIDRRASELLVKTKDGESFEIPIPPDTVRELIENGVPSVVREPRRS